MKKKTKDINNNSEFKIWSKDRSWSVDEENDGLLNNPKSAKWRKELIFNLFKFFEDEANITIDKFCRVFKIKRRTFYQWCQDYEDIRKARQDVMIFIADKRQEGCINGDLIYVPAYKDMHRYDPEWKEVDKYHADLKKAEEQAAKDFNVTMIMPKAKDKDE